MTAQTYFWASFVLWGIICAIAFESLVEVFLNKMLSDAGKQNAVETQAIEGKSEILDDMYEAIESNNEIASYAKDRMYNVRTEVKEIKPLGEHIEKVKTELNSLKREFKRLEGRVQYLPFCKSSGKALLPEFNMSVLRRKNSANANYGNYIAKEI